ncbi:MAG: DUF7662 domain-containing protein [Alcanivorax sp.]
MSKYAPLQNFLSHLKDETKKISFAEIEKILEFSLPASARKYPAWWANQDSGVQCSSWLKAGWISHDLDLGNETIMFTKRPFEAEKFLKNLRRKVKRNKVQLEPAPKPHEWDQIQQIKNAFHMVWQPLGKVILEQGRLSFPRVDIIPALYRFRIRRADCPEAVYVGETVNLRRRFGNYRNPGASQKTSLRINSVLTQALENGAEISISVITQDAWIDDGSGQQVLDLSSKVSRCFLENAAILNGCGIDIDSLNKAN